MTNEELKEAFMSGCEVKCGGITYKCVSAIVYRKNNGKVIVSAELQDKNTRSVSFATANKIERT